MHSLSYIAFVYSFSHWLLEHVKRCCVKKFKKNVNCSVCSSLLHFMLFTIKDLWWHFLAQLCNFVCRRRCSSLFHMTKLSTHKLHQTNMKLPKYIHSINRFLWLDLRSNLHCVTSVSIIFLCNHKLSFNFHKTKHRRMFNEDNDLIYKFKD